jgi:phosphate starvation-inducible PhoH-like protein
MKMFLTRIGMESRAVITGDVTQIDLPSGRPSGLVEARRLLREIREIAFVEFDKRDVVRHPLVQQIIAAYAEDTEAKLEAKRLAQQASEAMQVEGADAPDARHGRDRDETAADAVVREHTERAEPAGVGAGDEIDDGQ